MKVSELSLIKLLSLKTKFELPKNLRDSIMLRGLTAEYESRDSKGQEELLAKLEGKDKEIDGLMEDISDKEDEISELEEYEEKWETLHNFIADTQCDIGINILNLENDSSKKNLTEQQLVQEFIDLRAEMVRLCGKN